MNKNRGGQAPFGFRWYEGELIHEPAEASICALAFELFLVHQRKGKVARLLNDRGLRTRAGKGFTGPGIKRLLESLAVKGIHRSSITETSADGKPQSTVIESPIPPIVRKDIWNHVQAISESQQGTQSRSPRQDIFIGKVACNCGSLMELPSKKADYQCPSCDQKIAPIDVRAFIESEFSRLPLPSSEILRDRATTSLIEINTEPKKLLAAVERDIEKLFDLHAKDAITADAFKERHIVLEKRKKQLEASLSATTPPPSHESFIDTWHSLPSDMQRILVENLIDKIVITPSEATLSLYPLFNFAQVANTRTPSQPHSTS